MKDHKTPEEIRAKYFDHCKEPFKTESVYKVLTHMFCDVNYLDSICGINRVKHRRPVLVTNDIVDG